TCKPVPTTLPWWTTYSVPPSSIMTTACSGTFSAADMLNYTAFSIVFMIVSVAVPFTAAGTSGGTVDLALSHAFEAAFIAQTVVRPITSALQNGFKMAGKLGHLAKESNDGDAWLNSIDSTRATRHLDTTNPKNNRRVAAPRSSATSGIPTRDPKTMLIN